MDAQRINVNLIPGGVLPRINVSQYDYGRPIEVSLYDGPAIYNVPSNAEVTVEGTKRDNTGFQYECTFSDNVVYFDLTNQMSVFQGEVFVEIVIRVDGDRVGTGNFIIWVEKAGLQDDVVISETDIPIIEQIPEIKIETETARDEAVEAADEAKEIAKGLGTIIVPLGDIAFADLPSLESVVKGGMYNITDSFTTTADFTVGAGIKYPEDTNVYKLEIDGVSKWDVFIGPLGNGMMIFNSEAEYKVAKAAGEVPDGQIIAYRANEEDPDVREMIGDISKISGIGDGTLAGATSSINAGLTEAKIVVIEGAFYNVAGWSSYYETPDGYTKADCCLTGISVLTNDGAWRLGTGTISTDSVKYRTFCEHSQNGVRVYNDDPQLFGHLFKVSLFKFR